jgi:hypothetical protein
MMLYSRDALNIAGLISKYREKHESLYPIVFCYRNITFGCLRWLLILLNEQHDISTSCDECNWFHRMRASKVFPEQYVRRLEKIANPLSVIATFRNSASMIIFPFKSDGLELSVEQRWVSYSYGTKTEAPVVRCRKAAELPVEFLTLFYPYLGTPPKIDLSEIQKTASAFMEGES